MYAVYRRIFAGVLIIIRLNAAKASCLIRNEIFGSKRSGGFKLACVAGGISCASAFVLVAKP